MNQTEGDKEENKNVLHALFDQIYLYQTVNFMHFISGYSLRSYIFSCECCKYIIFIWKVNISRVCCEFRIFYYVIYVDWQCLSFCRAFTCFLFHSYLYILYLFLILMSVYCNTYVLPFWWLELKLCNMTCSEFSLFGCY
jgi:hypothetical protein